VNSDKKLNFQDMLNKFLEWGKNYLPQLVGALIIFIIGWVLAGWINKIIKSAMIRTKVDAGIVSFVNSVSKTVLRIVVLIAAASMLGLDTSVLVTALGAATVTVGLALKDSLSNIASGTLIIINKPFKVGDFIKMEDLEGEVKKIEIFFTTLISKDGEKITIPNTNFLTKNVTNKTDKNQN